MPLFSGLNYYSEGQEDHHSFTHKLTGMAKLAAIIGVGLVAGRPLLQAAGKAGLALAGGKSERTILGLLGSKLGVTSEEDVIHNITSGASQALFGLGEQIEQSSITFATNFKRIRAFTEALEPHVADESKTAYTAARGQLEGMLAEVGRAGRGHETEETFLGTHIIKRFNSMSEDLGVKYKFNSLNEQEKRFRELIDQSVNQKASRESLQSIMASIKNRRTIIETMRKSVGYHGERTRATKKLFGFTKHKDITWGDLVDRPGNEDTRAAVNRMLDNMGALTHRPDGETAVDTLIKRFQATADKLFDYTGSTGLPGSHPEKNEFMDIFHKTETGFIKTTKNGRTEIVPLHKFRAVKDEFLDKAINELQIPLVPYKFSIPMKTFTNMFKPNSRVITRLGHAINNPELMRQAGFKDSVTAHTQLLGTGNTLLAISPDTENEAGTMGVIQAVEGRYTSFSHSDSAHFRRLTKARQNKPDDYLESLFQFRDRDDKSNLENRLYNNAQRFSRLIYDEKTDGWKVESKSVVFNPLVRKLYGTGFNVAVEDLHPLQLMDYLKDSAHSLGLKDKSPIAYNKAINYLINQASQGTTDISEELIRIGREYNYGSRKLDFSKTFDGAIRRMLLNADNPEELRESLNLRYKGQQSTHTGKPDIITNLDSELSKETSYKFSRAISMLGGEKQGHLSNTTPKEGGIIQGVLNSTLGHDGISTPLSQLQTGLLAEVVHGMGVQKIQDLLGDTSLINLTHSLEDNLDLSHPLIDFMKDKGFSTNQIRSAFSGILEKRTKDGEQFEAINRSRLGELGSLLLDNKELGGLSSNEHVRMNILDIMSQHVQGKGLLDTVTLEKRNYILTKMSEDFDLADALKNRFKMGRPFHPEELTDNPFSDATNFVVRTNIPSLSELYNMSGDERLAFLTDMTKNGFGIGDYLKALGRPEAAHGQLSALTQVLLQTPQNIGKEIGLGIPEQDRITTLRSILGYGLKRVLPLYVGVEAYKNINANMHHAGLLGLDDMAANLLANGRLSLASIKDLVGATGMDKGLVYSIPGLDQYFTPRSRDEEQEYLHYGDEAVRQGRFWFIGSRSNLTGGAVDYYRPNFYRRWTSHWTEADNVDISNPEHSWLPNTQNVLGIFNPKVFLHPHWWEEKHAQDRPYGTFTGVHEPTGYTINSSSAYGSMGIGTFGGGYNPGMYGGGPGHGSGGGAIPTNAQGDPEYASGDKIHLGFHKEQSLMDLRYLTPYNMFARGVHIAREQMGLYGALMQRLPFYPEEHGAFDIQTPHNARSLNRLLWGGDYGELTGLYGEFGRRFVPMENQDLDAYNENPNNSPSWLPTKFHHGDMYMRTGAGELNLPGESYLQSHKWVSPMKVRGSVIGGTEQEIIDSWLNPMKELEGDGVEDVVDFGSFAHRAIQHQINDLGILVGAETSIYDKEHNISGTIDAIVNGDSGPEIVDIKTQGSKGWGHTPDKYIDQINTYMAITGYHRAHLAFVNRDNMSQTRIEDYDFDPERWKNTLEKVERARAVVQQMSADGDVSPFETYDLLSRIEILAKVAPNSPEYRAAIEFAEKGGGFGGFEKQRLNQAIGQAKKLKEKYNLYPLRYNVHTENQNLRVDDITDDGNILTNLGTIKLAGVKWDNQAFGLDDASDVLAHYGIHRGGYINARLLKGQLNPELMIDEPLEAIVGLTNERLIRSKYAKPDLENRNPLSTQVVFHNSLLKKIEEKIIHSDNMLSNKIFRTRTGLEQFERGEVYGTDRSRLSAIYDTMIVPTVQSFIHKDPISAGIAGALLTGMFFRSKDARIQAMKIGALAFSSMSMIRMTEELATGKPWTPHRYKRSIEFDEYWDTLNYLKETANAEGAKEKAKQEEGVDIDSLNSNEERVNKNIGPWSILAINADRKARETMYGYNEAAGSLQQALAAIPDRHRQIAESLITTGSTKEKTKFYDLLGDSERRVLGKFLGVKHRDIPQRQDLTHYFKSHFLPGPEWDGWSGNSDMNDLKTRSAALEDIKVDQPSRERVEKARAYSKGIAIPRMDNPTIGMVRSAINDVIRSGGYNRLDVSYSIHPSTKNVINVDTDLFEDKTNELIHQMREQSQSGS